MMMRWTLWAGLAAPVLGPVASAVTSSHARTPNPAASIILRISPGARRKLARASRAHITGNTIGWQGAATRSLRARPRVPRPHHREHDRLDGAGHRLLQREQPARAQRTREARIEPLLVGDVHTAVLRPHNVEHLAVYVERQRV